MSRSIRRPPDREERDDRDLEPAFRPALRRARIDAEPPPFLELPRRLDDRLLLAAISRFSRAAGRGRAPPTRDAGYTPANPGPDALAPTEPTPAGNRML